MGRFPGCGRGGMNCGPGVGPGVSPAEQADFHAFDVEPVVEKKIALGEAFDQRYPKSAYKEQVDTELSYLYFDDGDYPKFSAAADRVLALNPKSVPILEVVGWLIPRRYDANDPDAARKLDEAEKYEKSALAIVAAMKRPRQVTPAEFANSQASLAWRAHSGLGTVYFRRKDFADSATELQLALKQEGSEPDPTDLYVLGIDLEKLGRMSDAADDFAQCSVMSGGMQQQCQQAYESASHAAAETAEEKAYDAFMNAPDVDEQIQLGEKFDKTYPASNYEENVDAALVALYADKKSWDKFYATAAQVLARDPDNVPVLTVLGWIIPRRYDMDTPDGAAKLDQAEQYEKHALVVIAAMKKPSNLTADEFAQAEEDALLRAHSGLGATYFREHDYADSAKELQQATTIGTDSDEFDYYVLGVDLHQLNQPRQAADAFVKCAGLPGYLQMQCKSDADFASQTAAQLSAVAAKTASSEPVSVDIPPSIAQQASAPIKAETIVIPVRVVVRDAKGRAIANLPKEDFKIYQDGNLQEITSFSAIAAQNASPVIAALGKTPASVTATPPDRFVALFFDDVNTKSVDLIETRAAAEKYLDSLQPADRVAIATASGLGEADFTSDRDKLRQALLGLKPRVVVAGVSAPGTPTACPPMDYAEADAIETQDGSVQQAQDLPESIGSAAPMHPITVAINDVLQCRFGGSTDFVEPAISIVHGAARAQFTAADRDAETVLDRLADLIRRISLFPGQHEIVLVSSEFVDKGHEAQLSEVVDQALRYSVVVNVLDAEGLATHIADASLIGANARAAAGAAALLSRLDRTEELDSYSSFDELTSGTGGIFFRNDNGFAEGFRELAAEPEAYYLISYSPQNLPADGKFHPIKVVVAGTADATVQARRGFYAPSHLETPEEAAKREIQDALFSRDEQRDLPVKLETAVAPDADGTEKLSVKATVDPSGLRFSKSGGTNQDALTVSAAIFDMNGNYVTGTQKIDNMNLDDSTLARLEKSGFYVEMDFDVKPGDYVVRLVTRDANDGRISAQNATLAAPN
jgi:VWFA-related protein